jgi:hypothetical protein
MDLHRQNSAICYYLIYLYDIKRQGIDHRHNSRGNIARLKVNNGNSFL